MNSLPVPLNFNHSMAFTYFRYKHIVESCSNYMVKGNALFLHWIRDGRQLLDSRQGQGLKVFLYFSVTEENILRARSCLSVCLLVVSFSHLPPTPSPAQGDARGLHFQGSKLQEHPPRGSAHRDSSK